MQTLKTAVVVVLLLVVLYGAYVAINAPDPIRPPELQRLTETGEQLDLELDVEVPELGMPPGAHAFQSDSPDAVVAHLDSQAAPAGVIRLPTPTDEAEELEVSGDIAYPSTVYDAVPENLWSGASVATGAPEPVNGGSENGGAASSGSDAVAVSLSDAAGEEESAAAAPASPSKGADSIGLPQSLEGPENAAEASRNIGFDNALAAADAQVSQGRLREALFTLTVFYQSPDLTAEQNEKLLTRLDALAREVIYSRRHLTEQPYRVGHGETLEQVADKFAVPWQVLARINGIAGPEQLAAGTELKTIRGPFRAEVSLQRKELTLFLGDLYAGRFPLQLGSSPAPVEGTYTVVEKKSGRQYVNAEGQEIPAGDPRNPYGSLYLDLGRQMVIHGAPPEGSEAEAMCIRLAADDARDVHGILSQGSSITIRR